MNDQAFAALREECDRLSAENSELRRLLRFDPEPSFVDQVKRSLRVPPLAARVLWVLWECKPKTHVQILNSLYWDRVEAPGIKIVQVQVCRLRAALHEIGSGIETVWGNGYRLDPDQRAKIAAHIGIEVQP